MESSYTFESIIFESPRSTSRIEIKNSVLDLVVNEHIEKSWLTGVIQIKDDEGFSYKSDILGGEKITVSLKSTRPGAKVITKVFYIDKILRNARVNDSSDVLILHLIEDTGYVANLININRAYEGKCSEIIQKIAKNFIQKEVAVLGSERQNIKLIIPNLNPIEAMSWIKNRASTVDGYPFFLYSTFVGEKLKMVDLGTLVSSNVMNPDVPYRFFEGATLSDDISISRRVIQEFNQEMTEDLFSVIQKGLISGDYKYIDTVKNTTNQFEFDVVKDLLKPMISKGTLARNVNPLYSPDYQLNGKAFNTLKSRSITQIGGSMAFDSNKSYAESDQISDYKLNVISRSVLELLKKAPLQITVEGFDFIDGEYPTTIGNNLRIEFLSQNQDTGSFIDPKKSGDYMIYATEHQFKREKYDIKLSCVKLGNYQNVNSK